MKNNAELYFKLGCGLLAGAVSFIPNVLIAGFVIAPALNINVNLNGSGQNPAVYAIAGALTTTAIALAYKATGYCITLCNKGLKEMMNNLRTDVYTPFNIAKSAVTQCVEHISTNNIKYYATIATCAGLGAIAAKCIGFNDSQTRNIAIATGAVISGLFGAALAEQMCK